MIKFNDKWVSKDTAFMLTKAGTGPCKSSMFPNLYSVGPHNGRGNYAFTSMESAVENAIALVHDLVPESKRKIKLKKSLTIINAIFYLIGFVLLCGLVYLLGNLMQV